MANGAQFVVELVDRITGPAKKAAAAIQGLGKASDAGSAGGKKLDEAAKSTKGVGDAADKAAKTVEKLGKSEKAAEKDTQQLAKATGEAGKKAKDSGKDTESLVDQVGKLQAALAALAAAFAVYKIDQLFKDAFGTAAKEAGKLDSNIKALTFRLGSVKEAREAEAKLTSMTEGTGFKASDAEKLFQQQLREGVGKDLAMTMTQFAMNAGAMAGGPEEARKAADGAIQEFINLRSGERWNNMAGSWDKIRATSGKFGVDDDSLMKVLHERFGKFQGKQLDLAQFKRALQNGSGMGIRNSDMMLAITEAVKRQSVAAGGDGAMGIAKQMGQSFEGLQEQVKNLPERVVRKYATDGMFKGLETEATRVMAKFLEVGDTSTGVGKRMEQAWATVSTATAQAGGELTNGGIEGNMLIIADVIEVLGVAWAGFYGALMSTFSAVGEVFNEIFGPTTGDNVAFLKEGLTRIAKVLGYVFAGIAIALGVVIVVIGEVVAALGFLPEMLGAIADFVEGGFLTMIASGLEELWGWFVWAAGKIGGWATDAWDSITKPFKDAWNVLSGIGKNIVDGLWSGIQGAWGTLLSGFKSLVALLPDGVKKVLGIASPSRVMMGLGAFTGEGFAAGVEKTDMASAVETLTSPLTNLDGGAFGDLPLGMDVNGLGDGMALRPTALGPVASSMVAGAASTSNANSMHVGDIHINVTAAGGSGEDIADAVRTAAREELIAALSGIATEGGSLHAAY